MGKNPEHPKWGGKRAGAGRKSPTEGKKESVCICLSPETLKLAQMVSKGQGITFSVLVEQALRALLKATFNLTPMTKD